MSPLDELPPVDRAQLLHQVELLAVHDARVGTDLERSSDAVRRQVQQWADQRVAAVLAAGAAESALLGERSASAATAEAAARHAVAEAARAVGTEEGQRDRLRRVLRGDVRETDGGDWSDPARLSEDPRRARRVDLLVYGAAAVVDAGLNYLAFRLMGVSTVETVVLAGAVVLAAVLLPKHLGEVVTVARRTGRRSAWFWGVTIGGAAVWTATAAFAAVVRTAFLLLPGSTGLPPLLVRAGLDAPVLTAGWFAVAVAVAAIVFLRAARRHNPAAAAWHENTASLARLRAELADRRAAELAAAHRTAAERDRSAAVPGRVGPMVDESRAVAAELVARYEHLIAQRSTPEEHRVPAEPGLTALPGRSHQDGSSASGRVARTPGGAP